MKEIDNLVFDYFENLKQYVNDNYEIDSYESEQYDIIIENILGYDVNDNVKYIYEHYKSFELLWFANNSYRGEINYVSYEKLEEEHNELVDIMNEIYDVENDNFDIQQDIINWYPLFYFGNGDAFCLDIRDGSVVFYEHDVYDDGKNMHGFKIANSLNELFDKWSKIHFADVYYWDEICDDNGINLDSEIAKKYI